MSDLISIVIPSFNYDIYIEKCIDSVYNQNLDVDFEVIVVDDNSEDFTIDYIKEYTKKYDNFRYYENDKNYGGGYSRNKGISKSRGNYILNLDADNFLEYEYSLQILYNELKNKPVDVSMFSTVKFYGLDEKLYNILSFNRKIYDIFSLFEYGNSIVSYGNFLFTRRMAEDIKYPENYAAQDTFGFGVDFLMSGYRISVVQEDIYYIHRCGHKSYWVREETKKTNNRFALEIVKKYIDYFDENSKKLLLADDAEEKFYHNLNNEFKFSEEFTKKYYDGVMK